MFGEKGSARRAWLVVLLLSVGLLLLPAVAWFAFPSVELAPAGSAGPVAGSAGSPLPSSLVGKPKRRVEGAVIDAQGAPVLRAEVKATQGEKVVTSSRTSASGSFTMRVPDGATTLTASAPGYATASVEIAEQGDVSSLELTLEKATTFSGSVVDSEGKAVKGAVIVCEEDPASSVISDEAGRFALPAAVQACTATADHADLGTTPKLALVKGGKNVLAFAGAGKIAGTVADDQGRPIASFIVGVESYRPAAGAAKQIYPEKRVQDDAGAFTLEGLGPGTYVLTASAAGRPPTKSREITLDAGESVRGVSITLGKGITLSGTITDRATGAPIAGATVRLDAATSSGATATDAATTDDAGRFSLEGVPAGPFSVRARHRDYKERIVTLDGSQQNGKMSKDIDLAKRGPGEADMEMTGVGATLSSGNPYVVVASVLAGGPAEAAGVQAGDRIERIEGRSAEGFSVSDCVQRLRGPEGTRVSVTLGRDGKKIDLTMTRAKIER